MGPVVRCPQKLARHRLRSRSGRPRGRSFALGVVEAAACGGLSLYGDLVSSFLKRRLALAPGTRVPALDHLPEAALPLLAFWHADASVAVTALVSSIAFIVLAMIVDALPLRRATGH